MVVLALAMLVGCGDDDDNEEVSTDATTSTTSTTSTTMATTTSSDPSAPATSAPPADGFGGITTPTSLPGSPAQVALLTDVTVAAQEGFDRVVFEFADDQVPGVEIAYAEGPVLQAGSGEPIEVAGAAALEVRMEPASGVDLGGSLEPTYTGPERVTARGTPVVTEVVRTGDFEANLSWAIGAERRVPYRVEVLTGPARVVIDLSST